MSLVGDTYTLLLRELLIFKKNLIPNIMRSLIFPLLFIILLGSFGSTPKNVPVAVVNLDNSAAALGFINHLESGGSITVTSQTNQQQAMSLLSQGQVAGVIVIPEGFSGAGPGNGIYVYLDNSQPQSAAVVSETVDAVAANPSGVLDPTNIPVITNYVYGAGSNYLSFVVGGLLVMVAAFGAVFTAGFTLLSDRELGNLKAFLTTPINEFSVLLSKILYGTFQSFLSALIGFVIGLLYGATVAAGVVGAIEMIWIIFLVGLGFSALAMCFASIARQFQNYAMMAQTTVLPLSFLAGAFVPVTLLPTFLLPFVAVNPLTYAVNAVRDVMIKGFLPPSTLLFASVVLLAFTGVMMGLALIFFKRTNKQL
jgi:ABC-2 type transport system permease protein